MASVYRQPRATLSRQDIDGEMEQLAFTCEFGSEADVFRATVLWDKIVVHLERSVKRGRRSQGLRIFVNCFLGSKAVECLVVYLNTILPKTVQRAQVLILCEKLLITGVIQDVRSKEKTAFRENKLYRFTGNHFWEAEVISSQDESLVRFTAIYFLLGLNYQNSALIIIVHCKFGLPSVCGWGLASVS